MRVVGSDQASTCTADPTDQQSQQISVTVDPVNTIADCHPGNNRGIISVGYCSG